ncbi:hypothetical protein GUJ93_ZPchr0014g46621 [Zizania palustris]|uniref:Subtilisin-like protease fibronectin type-III domain-containing protein n=1 Tax=Zizania palustris TaxID=103762 RepID=A0A8J5W0T9_ZIZPA|nr:hypothetical protein GUJ93_ZPchr0014g46621 [Zizania palustris]
MARRLKLAEFSWPLKTFTKNSSMRCSHTFSSASDLNYPAISVVFADQPSKPLTVRRTVTNVGPPSSTYHIKVAQKTPEFGALSWSDGVLTWLPPIHSDLFGCWCIKQITGQKHMRTDLWDSKSDISW